MSQQQQQQQQQQLCEKTSVTKKRINEIATNFILNGFRARNLIIIIFPSSKVNPINI